MKYGWTSPLRRGGLRRERRRETLDPMEGMGNLADVMLVLAVGFLLALIMSWNMDLMNQGPSVTEIGAMNQTEANPLDPGQGYEPMGRVYRDPVSGRLYLVTDEQTSE